MDATDEYNMDDAAGEDGSEGSSEERSQSEDSGDEDAGEASDRSSSSEPEPDDNDDSVATPAVKVSAASPEDAMRLDPPSPSTLRRSPPWKGYRALVLERRRLATTPRSFGKTPIIDPILTIPHGVPVQSLCMPPCGTHVFSGGADGFIRRIGLYESATGSNAENLTMRAGGHVGAVDKDADPEPKIFLAGYWENEDDLVPHATPRADGRVRWGPKSVGNATRVSPVYSMAIHTEELWGLTGTELGNINLFTIRHDEGQIRHVLRAVPKDSPTLDRSYGHRHGSPVSSLALDDDQTRLLSGAWDGDILEWDLNTGQVVNRFDSHTSQISTVAFRPIPPTPLYDTKDSETDKPDDEPVDLGESLADPPAAEGQDQPLEKSDEGMKVDETPAAAPQKTPKSPGDGFDPLFDEDDASGSDAAGSPDDVYVEPAAAKKPNGSGPPKPPATGVAALPPVTDASLPALSPDVFLGSAIDGQTLLWDRRIKGTGNGYVRRLPISPGASPWATSAAWSTDGNAVFVGRRNTCVDVYDLRQVRPDPAAAAQRTIRLPLMSGPVSCVLPWPDGKNLVCGSFDNIRLYNLQAEADGAKVPFRIIPGHSTGTISQMCVTPSQRFFVTASGDRGWDALSTDVVVLHEIRNP